MNEEFKDGPSDVRDNTVLLKPKDINFLAVSDPLAIYDKGNKDYDSSIKKHVETINSRVAAVQDRDRNSLVTEINSLIQKKEPAIYNGERTYRLFHTLNGERRQETVQLLEKFNQMKGNHFVFDIETFGDSGQREKPFGISEVAIGEYNEKGELVKKTFHQTFRQDGDILAHLEDLVKQVSEDKYSYNTMTDYEKRSLVDLMRYATYKEDSDSHAFTNENGEIRHHSISESVMDAKDRVDHGKVVRELDKMYLPYIKSGLDTLKNTGVDGKEAIEAVTKIMEAHPDKFFVSYNGNPFDVPVLKDFAEKKKVAFPSFKHLDYLNAIKTVNMDSDVLKKKAHENIRQEILSLTGGNEDIGEFVPSHYGKDKLAANRQLAVSWDRLERRRKGIMTDDDVDLQKDAHNAFADINDTAKVVASTREPLGDQVKSSRTPILDGFNHHPTQMTWNDAELHNGQNLFASGGVQAFREGDESFRMILDDDGKWIPSSSGFDNTIINSKTFYQFAGHEDLGDGKLAFRFFNPEANELSYIVRKGEHAFAELQDFVQSRFYNYDNIPEQERRNIDHVITTDRARRRYDRYFSVEGGGRGIAVVDGEVVEKGTKGFSGLKRMLANAEKMEKHLDSNKDFKSRVQALINQGMSRKEARAEIRDVMAVNTLVESMDFDSQWDPVKKEYVFNQKEKDHFFKMYGRLIDELPSLNEAVNSIDAEFSDEINKVAKIKDNSKRVQALRVVNQKRDRAITSYYNQVTQAYGEPTQTRKLQQFESQRLSYFDPEANDYRSLNFETPESTRNSLYGYAKRGVDRNDPKSERLKKERLNNLLENLHSQNIISGAQRDAYIDSLWKTDSVYNASGEIAISMRQKSGGKYDKELVEPAMNHNEGIKKIDKGINHVFIERAIQDSRNALLVIDEKNVKGKQLGLNEEMKKTFDILDQTHFSRLSPNNFAAIEELVKSIRETDPTKHIALAMNGNVADNANMKVYAYDPKDSISVNNQLERGTVPAQALEFDMPLISQTGIHTVGNQRINAHSYAVYDEGKIKEISSAQYIARGYTENMPHIMRTFNQTNDKGVRTGTQKANEIAKRRLRDRTENMSGASRNAGQNDSYKVAFDQSDNWKQSHVKLANAMIEDLYYNGYDGIKLTTEDFRQGNDVLVHTKNGVKLQRGLTFDDLQTNKMYDILLKQQKWAKEKLGQDLTPDSVKDAHVTSGTLSKQSSRELLPYGTFYNHGRDNAVQFQNAYKITEDTSKRLEEVEGINRDRLLLTPRQEEYEKLTGGDNVSFNGRVGVMSQDQLMARVKEMVQDPQHREMLTDIGILDEQGKVDWLKVPRVHEQQVTIAQDLSDALEVENEKRYAKGKQFKINKDLQIGSEIKPGQELGVRIHDNGTHETVRYEGQHTAQLIDGVDTNKDLLVRWKSQPFKTFMDGEKGTDSQIDRRFLTAVTGRTDIVGLMNPNVAKHNDFGMLMSGEARYMAEEINKMKPKDRNKALSIIENHNLGLEWDHQRNGWSDKSFDVEINKTQFNDAFAELEEKKVMKSPVANGIRFGTYEFHLAKVENHHKAVDETGRRVIDYHEGYNAETGEYEVRKEYGKRDGVKWSHREMGILKQRGLDKTYEHVFLTMMERQNELAQTRSVTPLAEVENMIESIKNIGAEDAKAMGLDADKFESLPKEFRNANSYKGTIFDREAVTSLASKYGNEHTANTHGFWINLPSVKGETGIENKVTVRTEATGDPKEIDKLFIPFTDMAETNGDVNLRQNQQHIARIFERADEVTKAESADDARSSHEKLRRAVNDYVDNNGFHELSSSKGMMQKEVFSTRMGTSASGLFKLMDYETSQNYGKGEHVVINPETAKKMGVFDQLKEIQWRREAGETVDDLYTASVRFPSFHQGALQFGKLHMSESVKEGEFHTTSFASLLQAADSDGDGDHIVVIDEPDIQKEWKGAHDRTQKDFANRWDDHVKDSLKTTQGATLDNTVSTEDGMIPKNKEATSHEMAAKIGKMGIGPASNLGLAIRQVADAHMKDDPEAYKIVHEFTRGLEQKPISSKHGASPTAARDLVQAIYSGNWDEASRIDKDSYDGMFTKDFKMNVVAEKLPVALQRTSNNLKSPGMRFGMSTGVSPKLGVNTMTALLHGTADPAEFGGENHALGMWHKYLRDYRDTPVNIGEGHETTPLERLTNTPMKERVDNTKGILNKARNIASDAVGGGVSDVRSKVGKLWESIKGMSGKNKAITAGGLAVAGIAGYNILNDDKPEMRYIDEPKMEPGQEQIDRRMVPRPALDMSMGDMSSMTQNASINVAASGVGKYNQEQMAQMVTQGMQDTGMNAGPTRVSVTQSDNTQQLNKQWYRDKVRENM